jgi:hypothetical protein
LLVEEATNLVIQARTNMQGPSLEELETRFDNFVEAIQKQGI